ncbi:MAG: hypothetical protein ABJA67_09930 [Chthonomonadales bacterium]
MIKVFRLIGLAVVVCSLTIACSRASNAQQPEYESREIEGWNIRINQRLLKESPEPTAKAIGLLTTHLKEIIRAVPAPAVTRLKEVTLYLNPTYEGVRPGAEYHPGKQWLVDNKRDPNMVKGVEFTNISIFEAENRRMPVFVLHELAHSFHDRVLGFDNREIKAAYDRAKASGTYDKVERWHGDGRPNTFERAYAMVTPQEYFAESSEAYFGRNDFYPFTRDELKKHDPEMYKLLTKVWGVADLVDQTAPSKFSEIGPPPASLKLSPFYTKYVDADGYPVISSAKVNDFALKEAAYLINLMLAKRPDVKAAMVKSGSRMVVMAWNEFTTDIPEYANFKPKDYWDARARGLGGSETDPVCSCAEENVLAYRNDPYAKENILIHEFAHSIHLRGMVNVDPTFDKRVKATFKKAMDAGLWKGKYASTNHHEYFAEGVQSWFDNNRFNDFDHNHVHTRVQLKEYDPGLAALCEEVFGETKLTYTYPTTRLAGHLEGYDPFKSPTFIWPDRLLEAKAAIRKQAEDRDRKANEKKP